MMRPMVSPTQTIFVHYNIQFKHRTTFHQIEYIVEMLGSHFLIHLQYISLEKYFTIHAKNKTKRNKANECKFNKTNEW